MKLSLERVVLVTTTLILISCGGGNSADTSTEDTSEEMVVEEKEESQESKVVYYGTPSLVEVAGIMKSSGATFSGDLLNDPSMSGQYSTQREKALNLGVYGADLTYSAMFDETQQSINYLKTIKEMAEDLGLTGAFESDLLASIEKNISNRDSLLDVITDFYWSADAYLADNDRMDVASMIVVGGWVESMYIACDMAHNNPENTEIRKRIGEQKLILKNLMLFLKSAAGDSDDVNELTGMIKGIQDVYNSFEISHGESTNTTNEEKGETVIGNQTEVEFTQENLDALCTELSKVRSTFIQKQ